MADVKISIIMPVYGVENFVGRAIESIQAQSFTEWEMFAVDDGSKDKSGEICDEYARKDPRIKVIHKENGGAPSARNTAIPLVQGKYTYFMDSDDYAEPTMLGDMYSLAEKHGAQCVVAGYYIDTYHSDTEYTSQELSRPDAVYEKEEFRRNAYRLFDTNLLYTPWNKLYLTSYIHENGLLFPNTFWDDFPFNLSVIRDVSRVVVTSEKYYHFIRARADSETAKYRPGMYNKREEEHGWMTELYNYWGIDDENSREFISRRYIERFIGCAENVTNPDCTLSSKEKRAEIKKMLKNPNVKQALSDAKAHSLYMKIMLIPYRMKSTPLVYLESKLITFVKRKLPRLFTKLKADR